MGVAQDEGATRPTAEASRLPLMDMLRGFALLGVFLMNIDFFNRPLMAYSAGIDGGTGIDTVAAVLVHVLVQGKFWVLFALLFGMGFALMRDRAVAAGRPFVAVYLRRLLLLATFGALHIVLLWPGDILLAYAMAALGLLALGRLSGNGAWVLGAMLYVGLSVLAVAFGLLLMVMPPEALAPVRDEYAAMGVAIDAAAKVYSTGGFAEVTVQRVEDYIQLLGSVVFFQLPMMLGVFLIGRWFVASGRLQAPERHHRFFVMLAAVGLLLGAAGVAGSLAFGSRFDLATEFAEGTAATGLMTLASLPLSLAYLALFVLAAQTGTGQRLLAPLAPAGRMALTNYLMQSLVASLVFYGYGFGLAGEVGRAAQVAFVIVVFAAQVAFSRWWLARFTMGPLEWLWRAGTYLQWPPMRRVTAG
ncbi:MAG: DUF418 domain-containing protein [Lysobacteraceae bacterium]|jgi:uncharacterized protein|nr:DUF418 domain-containing protein [Xanthomonadaceae bacterium]MCZ8318059.1 DUF418 domain-containing protein [Silanimonas sp.]